MAEIGVIPKESAKAIWEKAGNVTFDVARIDEIERVTKHDVIAFLTHLAEFIGPEAGEDVFHQVGSRHAAPALLRTGKGRNLP
jgi:adenylosuccinate lyase